MTRGERFISAFSGGVPDRVPVLPKIYLGLAADLTGTNLNSLIGKPREVLDTLVAAAQIAGADAVRLFQFPHRKIIFQKENAFEVDSKGKILGKIDLQGGLSTILEDPGMIDLQNPVFAAFNHFYESSKPIIRDIADAKKLTVPDKSFYVEYGCADRQRDALTQVEDLGLVGDCDTATMAFLVTMRGMNTAMLDLYDNPELVGLIMDKGVQIAAQRGKFLIDTGIRVLRINDSVGNMSVISPAQWREFVAPRLKDLCTELHAYCGDVKLYCHICGNILPIVEDLVTSGLDCIAPLDPLGGFSPAQVRERVGDEFTLMGGVNTLSFIQNTPEQIREEALRCIEEAGSRGRFILGSGCVVPRYTTLESIRALSDASMTYGRN